MSHSIWKEALDSLDDCFLKTEDLKAIAEKRRKQRKNSVFCIVLLAAIGVSVIVFGRPFSGGTHVYQGELSRTGPEEGYTLIRYQVPEQYTVGDLYILSYQDDEYIERKQQEYSGLISGRNADYLWAFSLDKDKQPSDRSIFIVLSDNRSIQQIWSVGTQNARTEIPSWLEKTDEFRRMLEALSSLTSADNPAILAMGKTGRYLIINENAYTTDNPTDYSETVPYISVNYEECRVIKIPLK